MLKNATKCNKTLSKWCKNKHGASKIMDTLEMYQDAAPGDDLPKPPPPPRKKMIEPELVLVSSSGEPSSPKSHVSPKILDL
jgi:hypothetical protein